jgi:hypothetical protein
VSAFEVFERMTRGGPGHPLGAPAWNVAHPERVCPGVRLVAAGIAHRPWAFRRTGVCQTCGGLFAVTNADRPYLHRRRDP